MYYIDDIIKVAHLFIIPSLGLYRNVFEIFFLEV
jgi:hypothetical protein